MRIIVFTDLHGNKEALEAIINDYKKIKYDRVICLGDSIGIGPCPYETLKLIKDNNIEMVMGNHESYHHKDYNVKLENNKNIHTIWTDNQLDQELKNYINNLPIKIDINYNNFKLTFSHFFIKSNDINNLFYDFKYLNNNYKDYINSNNFDYMFIGHEHKPCIKEYNNSKIYDLGSSGCVFDNKTYYHIIDINEDVKIDKIIVNYDREKFENNFKNYPFTEHLGLNFFGINLNKFDKYLLSLKDYDFKRFQERIIYTNKIIVGIKFDILKDISNKIDLKDIDKYINNNVLFEDTIINAYLLNRIKDYNNYIKYLKIFINYIDNWSTCDTLKFNIDNHEEDYFKLAREFINSDKIFIRRLGIRILFSFKNKINYLPRILLLINKLYNEKEYYVNMANAWLLTELLTFNKDYILNNINNLNLNKFVKSKFISKTNDSYRIDLDTKNKLKELLNE